MPASRRGTAGRPLEARPGLAYMGAMSCRAVLRRFFVPALAAAAVTVFSTDDVDAKGKRPPVIGVVTEGIAEKLYGAPKMKQKAAVGKVFTAICDGTLMSWKLTDFGDDGALVGNFVGGLKGKRCLLLDSPPNPVMAAKGRPNPTTAQISAAKLAATTALTTKKDGPPAKTDVVVFNDGEEFVAVASTIRQVTDPKSNCLEKGSVVVMSENDAGEWKVIFRPQPKGKNVCGYAFFTRADVDADGRDEIALRIDKEDEYGYRVLKRVKNSYDVIAK